MSRTASGTIASAIQEAVNDLVGAMPSTRSCEPYDYSMQFRDLRNELSDICFQLERIADNLETKEAK